jgi:S-adenosyl-L-methionine hydrolase (adenosine-forming)
MLVALASLAAAEDVAPKQPPTIVFMTDFGTNDDSVAICKGVIYSIAPDVRIVDLTHQVKPFSILDGARFLQDTTPYYSSGTIFLVVIDPGVGSERRALVVRSTRKQYFVMPDNGLISLVENRDGIEAVREIRNTGWMLGGTLSSTFHGRDIFSPVAAHLARGEDWALSGPELGPSDIKWLGVAPVKMGPRGLTGEVIATDGPYGNLITNITEDEFLRLGYHRQEKVEIRLNGQPISILFVRTFSDVPVHQPLIYIDSRGRLALAMNRGNFAQTHHVTPPVEIVISRAGH